MPILDLFMVGFLVVVVLVGVGSMFYVLTKDNSNKK